MSFVMFGTFNKYGGWQMKVIETCQRFYEKFDRYPNYIRMKEKTMDALFEEADKAYQDPYSEEHAVRDSKGNLMLPVQMKNESGFESDEWDEDYDSWEDYGEYSDEDFSDTMEEIPEEEDVIYPVRFSPNEDCTVSFVTNKFELKFLEGEDLPEDYYIVQFGEGPEDGGEDFEEEEAEELPQQEMLSA